MCSQTQACYCKGSQKFIADRGEQHASEPCRSLEARDSQSKGSARCIADVSAGFLGRTDRVDAAQETGDMSMGIGIDAGTVGWQAMLGAPR
jgi:hypothetical protein